MNLQTPANPNDVRCALPAIEAAHRVFMPFAIGVLVLFISAWTALSISMFFSHQQWQREAHRVQAVQTDVGTVRFVDASGQQRELRTPARKARRLATGEQVDILYVDGQESTQFADEAGGQMVLAQAFLVLSALMACYPLFLIRRLRSDSRRRERLKSLNQRVPAQSYRVAEEHIGNRSKRTVYRVFARFNHQGQWFEAASDQLDRDPGAAIDPTQLQVLLDPADPRQSMIATDTLPSRAR